MAHPHISATHTKDKHMREGHVEGEAWARHRMAKKGDGAEKQVLGETGAEKLRSGDEKRKGRKEGGGEGSWRLWNKI
jgi:hypothetical protein